MKNILKLICFFLFTINASCQVTTIIPLASYNFPNGAYLKDSNNTLTPYVGTWEGVINDKKYTFVFQVFTQHLNTSANGDYHYEDELRGKFKVVDLNTNQTLYNNLASTNYIDYNIKGSAIRNGNFSFFFLDSEAHCYNSATFILQNINGQPNKLRYCYFDYDSYGTLQGCSQYPNQTSIPMFLPKVDLILTKH